jgi:hypothetical protein
MSKVSDTPITDNAEIELECDDSCCAIYVTLNGKPYTGRIVSGEEMEKLERQLAEANRQIAEAKANVAKANKVIAEQAVKLAEKDKALEEFGDHKSGCNCYGVSEYDRKCTCGFSKAKEEAVNVRKIHSERKGV